MQSLWKINFVKFLNPIIFFAIYLGGCTFSLKRGEYIANDAAYYGKLEIFPDSTFEYKQRIGLSVKTSSGTWAVDQGHLVLNSEMQGPKEKIQVVEKKDDRPSRLFVRAWTFEGRIADMLYLYVVDFENTTREVVLDNNGEAYFKALGIKKIILSYPNDGGIVNYTHLVGDKEANVFDVRFHYDTLGNYKYFTDEGFVIKRRRLVGKENLRQYKYSSN